MDPRSIGVLIPLLGVGTAFVAVFGRTILRPILQAFQHPPHHAPNVQALEQKIAELESRLAGTEGSLETLLDEREFMRKLASGRTAASDVTPVP